MSSLLSQLSQLTLSHYLHISILSSYLLTIVLLLGAVLCTLPRPRSGDGRLVARGVFALGALASGAHTWYYMIRFLQFSYYNYLSAHPPALTAPFLLKFASWLEGTSLFDEAWRHVCSTPENWWWSSHICLFTVVWCAFVAIEGRRHSIPHLWLYPLLGQLMAISTATALFFLALFSSPTMDPPVPRSRLRLTTYLPILAALFPVLYTPYLSAEAFMPNLLLLHGLLLIPFLPLESPVVRELEDVGSTLAPSTLLGLLEGTTFAIRALALRALPKGGWRDLRTLVDTLLAHPAQSSIGFDAVHVSLLLVLYSLLRRGAWPSKAGAYEALGALGGILAVGPGVVAPLVFRGGLRERKKHTAKGGKKEKAYGQLKVEDMPRRTRSGRMYSDAVVPKS
ncbi:hypothetical protein CALCODRAFT_508448 [Calocera cornea HHB12733]|uniref:Uncharacterized protein n=1 Tax=Calocera cornea HHB12733 TaxID=1353952 RepID=A0A165GG60_9BASI|nr:hypothetical protein CALCODRAFT_508448 [Calocera cornea HHB12733]